MAAQNEVEWLLDVITDNWPDAELPDTLALRNRDEGETRYPDGRTEREKGVSTDRYVTVGVSTGSKSRQAYGTTPQYRVEAVLDVRIEGKHLSEWGEVDNDTGFKGLVNKVQYAINTQISYPSVQPTSDAIGFVEYYDCLVGTDTDLSPDELDYYRRDFDVTLRGDVDPRKGNSNTAFEATFEGPFIG